VDEGARHAPEPRQQTHGARRQQQEPEGQGGRVDVDTSRDDTK